MARADRKARRERRKERRRARRERRKTRKDLRIESKKRRADAGGIIGQIATGITGVVGAIEGVRNTNEGLGDPLGIDAGYKIVEDPEFEKTGFDMETIKKYWWVGAAVLVLFFFRKRLM